jgi:hypothetical protein
VAYGYVVVLKEIESKCFKFIWNGKPDKVNRNTLIGDFENDGLKMIAVDSYLIFSKSSWVSRLTDSKFIPYKFKTFTLYLFFKFRGRRHELTIKVKMGIIKAYMISTLPNIGMLKSWLRIKHNKDIKAFQIKIDEQTHRIQISQLADDTTPKMIYLLL